MRVKAKFLLSAMKPEQFPAPTVPEIAFLGRSNVGKSSLINALLGTRDAKVSSTPGRTRSINFFAIGADPIARPEMIFADLPGYGYAKLSKSVSAEWPTFINPYLAERVTLAICVCLIDSNIPPQAADEQLIAWMRANQRPYLMVGTKADRLSSNQKAKARREFGAAYDTDEILFCSAKTGTGIRELWAALRERAFPA
jgi:GTP-binding protein